MTKMLIMNGILAGTFETSKEKFQLICGYFKMYHTDMATFEVRTMSHQEAVGIITHEDASYSLYQEIKNGIRKNYRRGFINKYQFDTCVKDLQKDFFHEWEELGFHKNISRLTAELLATK